MKNKIFPLAVLLLAASFSSMAYAASGDKPLLLERDGELYYREADDFLNLDAIQDGGYWRLFEPLYADGDAYILELKSPYGHDSLSAEVTEGDITVEVERLRPENEPLRVRYAYHTLKLIPPAGRDTEADEDFSIQIRCGEKSFTLNGVLQESQVLPVFEGVRYRPGEGSLFRFDGELEDEEALIACAPNLTLSFLGDYGEETYNLKVDSAPSAGAAELFGGENLVCYSFTERPSFETSVTVRLTAPQEAVLYEWRNGRLYPVATDYLDGCHVFKTKVLNAYLYRQDG
ncbi:MAG: hypothetical protein HFG26_02320 [Provencibacterium sp.]|jgi:hypothetical protein|nr:hypothetical protein [Provencibacterium sp.]